MQRNSDYEVPPNPPFQILCAKLKKATENYLSHINPEPRDILSQSFAQLIGKRGLEGRERAKKWLSFFNETTDLRALHEVYLRIFDIQSKGPSTLLPNLELGSSVKLKEIFLETLKTHFACVADDESLAVNIAIHLGKSPRKLELLILEIVNSMARTLMPGAGAECLVELKRRAALQYTGNLLIRTLGQPQELQPLPQP